ncbi:hypothetical protein [Paenibacillus sp. y28]|uniref:hypothetical protein n=1 Tax=Paenibacillus sp. y28 TaxID=3129110 RepID=UPI00301AE939
MSPEQEQAQANKELLRASLMGDIREDVEYAGLTLADILWITVVTLGIGGLPVMLSALLPEGVLYKVGWFLLVFVVYTGMRYLKVPYRLRRWIRYIRTPKSGEDLGLLGVQEDSWLYRSPFVWQAVHRLTAPPWNTAVYDEREKRLGGFELFLRTAAQEQTDVSIHAEQVPDFRWELWEEKLAQNPDKPGIAAMTARRIARMKALAQGGAAMRSEYILRLAFREKALNKLQREDEPEGLTKEQLLRQRLIADIQDRHQRLLPYLHDAGHTTTPLSGYAVAEVLARHWDPLSWRAWKGQNGSWEEGKEETEELQNQWLTVQEEQAEQIPSGEEAKTGWKGWSACLDAFRKALGWCKQMIISLVQRLRRHRPGKPTKDIALSERMEIEKQEEFLLLEAHGGLQSAEEEHPSGQSPAEEGEPSPLLIITSPAPTGKTFVATGLAAANSTAAQPVTLLDLSPDQGAVSWLNPLLQGEQEGWKMYTSRNVPGLTLYTVQDPAVLMPERLGPFIAGQLQEKRRVIVDMPWSYPWRDTLLQLGQGVALVDTDYHHWMCWEQAAPAWQGQVWQNQSEVDMECLTQEHWQLPVSRRFETYPAVRQHLYQGRMMALEPDVRAAFEWRAQRCNVK